MNKQLFNDGWTFRKFQLGTELAQAQATSDWTAVEVPHDWLIFDTKNLYESGEGWYKKSFDIDTINDTDYFAFRFDGVYMDSRVYINGVEAFEWKNGYTTFEFDATPFLQVGTNEIIVRVIYESPNSRWYSGAGIYRNVWFKTGHQDRFISDGIYITATRVDEDVWQVAIDSELELHSGEYQVRHTVLDSCDQVITTAAQACSSKIDNQVLVVSNPKLWDVYAGNLYYVKSELLKDGLVVDVETNRFGFREIEMSPDGGFVINGRRIKLFGACQHHDLGALGAAMNKTALRRQMELLVKMGTNAIRTAHNVFAVEFQELADEMGILVVSEIFDMWKNSKTKNDYSRFFVSWAERDMASWIRRDRNCPSVIMWSIGNEISDTHHDRGGEATTKWLADMVTEHDPKGHAPATIGSNFMPWENARFCADIVKYAGYNYAEKYYEQHKPLYPDWIFYGSETCSTVQSRGVYKFPFAQSVMADDDEQCSSLGNSRTSWGARSTEGCIIDDRDHAYSLGQFIWTGTDYIGEPTPYHTKNSYLGQIDTAGFFKDSAYIFQAEWTDYKTAPMVHIFPYWDFTAGQLIDVRVTSNAPVIELFFNNDSQGKFNIDHANGKQLVGHWQIPYQVGALRAVAYDEHGAIIAEDVTKSFGDANKITLKPNKTTAIADGQDLIFVEIGTADEHGTHVANANNRIEVAVSGAGRLIGLDNGDATDYDSYKGTSRRLFSGKLLAIVAANHEAGEINLSVTSSGLTTATAIFSVVAGDVPLGTSTTLTTNQPTVVKEEIPIRKIELVTETQHLTEDQRCAVVKAKILPANATYSDLSWRVTNAAGIDSTIATFEVVSDNEVQITALGNGEFYLRCMTSNGAEKPRLISLLNFTATGLGEAFLDPYGFISGGLYTDSNIELTNGNDRGVATDRELESHIIFEGVNFGEIGSDTITLPLFPLMPNTFPIEIWEGIPHTADGELVDTVYYNLGSKWNTYQEQTYKLARRFKGLTTITFVLKQKVHIKGFSFEQPIKAFEQLGATDYNFISGDTYTITTDAVTGIGNNVTLRFDEMDFGDDGAAKIRICGATPLPSNTIQIRFNDDAGNEQIQVVEFANANTYEEQEFTIDKVAGLNQVSFIFLPGCQFDFKWFKFSS